jgi:hypothetical protein
MPDKKVFAHWAFRSIAAGLCGAAAHSLLMLLKSWSGILPAFQPYENLQARMSHLPGSDIYPLVPWILSFVSGATVIGFLFGRTYSVLPGQSALTKGLVFGLLAWTAMGLLFFPFVGLGLFATDGGAATALFSLAMLMAYSLVMALAYAALEF